MSRLKESPVKRFPGTVVIADPILFPAYMRWKEAVENAANRLPEDERDKFTAGQAGFMPEIAEAILPGVCACISEWHIQGLPERLTPETFPATPRMSSGRLLAWLVTEINAVIAEEEEIPPA